jgi:tetratricopeptide (TPR) repeat protein
MDTRRAPWNKDMRKFWKSAIDIRSSIRGEADPSLGVLLSRYGFACETAGDWTTAEEAYTRAYSLNPHHEAIDLAIHKTQMARFYIRQGMFAKAEAEAEAACYAARETTRSAGWSVARELADLIPEYQQHLQQAQAEKLIQAMLTISGDQVITAFDPQLLKLYNAYVSSGALDKARSLAEQRLTASSGCINDWNVNAWRLRLSDIDKRITLVPK